MSPSAWLAATGACVNGGAVVDVISVVDVVVDDTETADESDDA